MNGKKGMQEGTKVQIGNLEVKPGDVKQGWLAVEGCCYELPMTVICGGTGKVTLITGGVHNAEYVGIQAAVELAQELKPEEIPGTLVIIPIVNVSGFTHRTMSLVHEDGKNLNREFPSKEDGSVSACICRTIEKELFSKADYYIDLHCGDGYEELHPYVYYVGLVKESVKETALEMARQTSVDYIVESHVTAGGAYNYANSLGIPSILLERGGKGLWSREEVQADKQDVRRILSYLYQKPEICAGISKADASGKQIILKDVIYEISPFTGCWYPFHKAGDRFEEDEVLGEIRDFFGEVLYVCRAPQAGVILYQAASLSILEETPMITYAYL